MRFWSRPNQVPPTETTVPSSVSRCQTRPPTRSRASTRTTSWPARFNRLAAARRLKRAGQEVALVEARDRVGGRVWHRETDDGTVVSVGGTWLGRDQNRMFELCRELGLDTYPQFEDGDT